MALDTPDIINVPVRPNVNSIKITKIDGFLEKKQKWNGYKWIDICRFDGCISDNIKTGFCKIHIKTIQSSVKDNEKRERGLYCYRFDRSKFTWKLMCSHDLCTNVSQNKEVLCASHMEGDGSNTLQSSVGMASNFYNQILQDELNKKEQELIKKKKDENKKFKN